MCAPPPPQSAPQASAAFWKRVPMVCTVPADTAFILVYPSPALARTAGRMSDFARGVHRDQIHCPPVVLWPLCRSQGQIRHSCRVKDLVDVIAPSRVYGDPCTPSTRCIPGRGVVSVSCSRDACDVVHIFVSSGFLECDRAPSRLSCHVVEDVGDVGVRLALAVHRPVREGVRRAPCRPSSMS